MSFLDKAKTMDTLDAAASIMDGLKQINSDDHLDKNTELSPRQIELFTKIEYKDKLMKDVFKVDVHLTERVKNSFERKNVSKVRGGRTEAVTIMATLLDRFMHPVKAINRLFGAE
jgi:hypothetical protein